MTYNTAFKISFLLSAVIHILMFYPWPFFANFKAVPEIRFQKVELSYFMTGETEEMVVKDLKPITSVAGKAAKKNKVAAGTKVRTDAAKQKKASAGKSDRHEIGEVRSKDAAGAGVTVVDLGSPFKGDNSHQNYYQKIRQQIVLALEKNRGGFVREGEIQVRFTVKRSGVLKDLALYKSSGSGMRALERIVIESIKDASPFPAFTGGMNENELLFKLPIKFSFRLK